MAKRQTSGERLKKELGLAKYKEVRISRVVSLPYKAFFVWYDSHTTVPVTQQRILRVKRVATMVHGLQVAKGNVVHPQLTPPMLIQYFDGVYRDAYIFLIDVAGDWLMRRKESTGNTADRVILDLDRVEVSVHLSEALKHTGFTVWEFANKAPSDRNKYFFSVRQSLGRSGSRITNAYFKDLDINKNLVLKFTVTQTPNAITRKKKSWVKVMSLDSRIRNAHHYVVWVLFEALEDYLDEQEIEILRGPQGKNVSKKAQVIRKILRNATAKVHSNDMSFYWQGAWENASDLGYSIFPFTGTRGSGKWSKKHKGESPAIYITKHILEVMRVIPFNTISIAKILYNKEVVDEKGRPVKPHTSSDAEKTEV